MKRPSWMYKQSGAVPYRIVEGNIWILLISNRKGSKWIIPKGIVDRTLKASESALKEAREEAGVAGVILKPAIGKYSVKKWGSKCRIKVFMLNVKEEFDTWAESGFRKRKWVMFRDTGQYIRNRKLLEIFTEIPDFLAAYAEAESKAEAAAETETYKSRY